MPTGPRRATGPDAHKFKAVMSYVTSLYDEMDKLAKKAPKDSVSDLALGRVNRAIRDGKALLGPFDEYANDLNEFVAAGENPDTRDVVLVLGEIIGGLKRLNGQFNIVIGFR